VARFLATWLGGPYDPDRAAELAAAVPAVRPPEAEPGFAAIVALPGRRGTRET
jgi:hypothetical protein